MLQVGTRNMQNFALLQAVGDVGKPVMLKRGMSATIEEWLMAAEYVAQRGNLDIVLCERGIRTFETATRNTLDISRGAGGPRAWRTCRSSSTRRTPAAGATSSCRCPGPPSRSAPTASSSTCTRTPSSALCDGPQALVDGDLRALATAVRQLPPLMGRRPALPLA